jgi:hypothetical protein
MNIDNATSNFLNNMKRQRDILKARETKVSLIALRKQWLDKQKRDNYQSEYDRIRGLLEDSVLKGTSSHHIKKRINTLQKMDVGMRPTIKFDNLY